MNARQYPVGVPFMAVEQVSTRLVQALASSVAQDGSALRAGTVLDGRVLAVNQDESLKVATRYGVLDVDQSQVTLVGGGHGRSRLPPLADLIGTTVKLEVTGHGALGRLLVKVVAGGDTSGPGSGESDASATTVETGTRIAIEVAQAAARQDGLAPVFADAQQLATSASGLPDTLVQSLQDLASLALDGNNLLTATNLQEAIYASGLFLETRLARWVAGTAGPQFKSRVSLQSQDLKAALFGLKSSLDDWIARNGDNGAEPDPEPPDTNDPLMSSLAETSASPPDLSQPVGTGGFDTEALFAVLRPPPSVSPSGGQSLPQTAGPAGRPDLTSFSALGEWLQAAGQMPSSRALRRSAYGGAASSLDLPQRQPAPVDPAISSRPPPPRRGSLPQGQPAIAATDALPVRQIDLARRLAMKTENAIARISLGQYASLADHVVTPGHRGKSNAALINWLFEVPIRIADATSIIQFEIDEIDDHRPDGINDTKAWRVQFSLNVQPLGPVHGRLVLADHRLSVGLWAEDRVGATILQRSLPALRISLEAASFSIDDIHFAIGKPPSGPPVRAGGFVDRNA